MAVVQSVAQALDDQIGRGGIPRRSFDAALARTGDVLAGLRARYADGSLPLLRLPEKQDDLDQIATAASRLCADASDIVFFGTGGSSLGGQTVTQLAGCGVPGLGLLREGPRLHFLDNLDPETFLQVLARLPLVNARFVAVSKSGGTAETLMQTMAALEAVTVAGLASEIPGLFLGISEPAASGKRNGLRDLLTAHGVALLDHDPKVGGRYSVLSNVGMLAAAVAGLDVAAIRAGAASALAPVLAQKPAQDVPCAVGAALAVAAADSGKAITVLMAYADRLERFTHWYVQLWAESLGKNGKGTTPLAALGPVDQHSQAQLFLAGPRDKLITVITVGAAGEGPVIDATLASQAGEPGFGNKAVGDLVAAQSRAMIETFASNGIPVRTFHLDTLDEKHLGELLMHAMLETIIAGQLLGVDPFDQPAVEQAKVLAKKYLVG
jgi:glucose-6-phosphate isomerase